MALRKIITFPHPILRLTAEPVTQFDQELRKLVADMAETMYAAPGSGLAANQIGIAKQIAVIDISHRDEKKELTVLINPRIVQHEGEVVDEEGCLSVIDYTANVKRARKICVEALDIEGNRNDFEAEEWFARVIQHEVDHLLGKLFIDHISALKRTLYKKRLKKILLEQEEKAQSEERHFS